VEQLRRLHAPTVDDARIDMAEARQPSHWAIFNREQQMAAVRRK